MSDYQILDFDAQPFSHMDSPMRTVTLLMGSKITHPLYTAMLGFSCE